MIPVFNTLHTCDNPMFSRQLAAVLPEDDSLVHLDHLLIEDIRHRDLLLDTCKRKLRQIKADVLRRQNTKDVNDKHESMNVCKQEAGLSLVIMRTFRLKNVMVVTAYQVLWLCSADLNG